MNETICKYKKKYIFVTWLFILQHKLHLPVYIFPIGEPMRGNRWRRTPNFDFTTKSNSKLNLFIGIKIASSNIVFPLRKNIKIIGS